MSSTPNSVAPLAGLPIAIHSPVSSGEANDPIRLYSGVIEFTQNGATFKAEGDIFLRWLPTPRIRFEVPAVPSDTHPGLGEIALRLDDGTEIPRCFTTNLTAAFAWPGHPSGISGRIQQQVIRPKDDAVFYALFLLPNFVKMIGRPITYTGRDGRAARLKLSGSDWRITVDQAENISQATEYLTINSGIAVTHIGRLERDDENPFTATECWKILEALGWYFSFCCGRWTGPCLVYGFAADGQKAWEIWDHARIAPFRESIMWLETSVTEHLETPFPSFLNKWLDDDWKETVNIAIHWYIEALAQAGSIEGAIVLTQTALELLSSAVLVENFDWLNTEGYDRLTASHRIHLLFRWAGIPTGIPAELKYLTQQAKADNWPDTSTAMTAIRNTITHPTRKNRLIFARQTDEARAEAWNLGVWSLELCLLRLFDYQGTYGNRLKDRRAGQVEPVPWAPKVPPPPPK
jgi:hypothetical protein